MPAYKLIPACKDYLWGGDRLRTRFGVQSDLHPLAEAWVLSCHPDGACRMPDGTPLPDYLAAHPEALGTHGRQFSYFPVLIKLIDAHGDLSIQVHPGDDYALAHEGQHGKVEMWVVLEAEPGAFLYYGFDHEISREEFAERIRSHTLTEVLHVEPVKRGDVFFIPAGTLHAICHGIVVAEIQQSSNVTYRIYDYGRLGTDGKPRQLHIDQALDVTTRGPVRQPAPTGHLGSCRYFTSDDRTAPFTDTADDTSFVHLLVIEGTGTLTADGDTAPLAPGDSYFLPAGSGTFRVEGNCRVIVTRI
ncbi:MAG: type I phosphomannose isomerase catalytic subunit [Gemmiger sp.]|uniref:type I phosphomannose isomerase catalytic subunit n=1 Tax=Gemmiger sp. TaxID=2049027 RepID=UPI002E78331A|nr:type I phosphomannose isomerase catalytic subunit [Gemmiger sp.]MEE0799885.1 type I phosphomannose isomerase catalytic subunit [Gemmiger sp.]